MTNRSLESSVRARLFIHAKTTKQDFQRILTGYAKERLFYRLGQSPHVDQFWLKGTTLFDLWFCHPHWPTRDGDSPGQGAPVLDELQRAFQTAVGISNEDGISFEAELIQATEIRKAANYPGVRMHIPASIGQSRCDLQVDIGFDAAVIPSPARAPYLAILATRSVPELPVYPQYSVVAEKFEAITRSGMANTCIQDIFNLWFLQQFVAFEGPTLAEAIQSAFQQGQTPVPGLAPIGVTPIFAQDAQKQELWAVFLAKNTLETPDLQTVTEAISAFLIPVVGAVAVGKPFEQHWSAGGPWI
jgi:hypothetical protein